MTVGTAGHVDHGKSTLVEALTSIFPDRLAEERERGLTIDLGFAWFTLPSGREVSVVDVPGHERFVANMLAGVGGIDAVLLVIAADEGVMPQTREHLDIIDLLEIDTGVIALTKSDLVDEEWAALVEEDVRDTLADSRLARAPLVPVSAQRRTGLDALVATLDEVLTNRRPRRDHGGARIPIDRVFTMPGFGTVITGTLSADRCAWAITPACIPAHAAFGCGACSRIRRPSRLPNRAAESQSIWAGRIPRRRAAATCWRRQARSSRPAASTPDCGWCPRRRAR